MREPALGLKTSLLNGSSFLKRIQENLASVCKLPWAPLPAAHAPIHLLDEGRSRTAPRAQLGSTIVHAAVCGALLWMVAHPPKEPRNPSGQQGYKLPLVPRWLIAPDLGSAGRSGSSGGHDPLPPTSGELAPPSRIALVPPHLSDSRPHPLTVAVAIADTDAPEFSRPVNDLGLPWMLDKNNSEGMGKNGIGSGDHHGMGDGPGDGSGIADSPGRFGTAATPVICKVCPEPLYSEEARKTKMQGSVLLTVLVGADGRAKDVRIIRGIGMGLDESAVQAVRAWQFIPAKDAAHRPIASWIQVETAFRLF